MTPAATATTATPEAPIATIDRTLRGNMPVLDALRGLAILLVIAHRAMVTADPSGIAGRAVAAAMEAGWVGVQLFFVLSGFLITGILLDTRERRGYYRSFFARRVLRIFPLYYTVLLVAFVIVPLATGHQAAGHEHQIWLWTYLSNWAEPLGLGVGEFPHFWSLAVEEQFYLVWPFVVGAASRRALGGLCLVLVAAAIGSRLAVILSGMSREAAYQFTICRVDALAMGAGAALAMRTPAQAAWLQARQRTLVAVSALMFVVGIAATGAYQRTGTMNQVFGYTLLAWCAAVALVVAVLAQARGGRTWSPASLRSVGKYSYAMYVLHVPIHHHLGVPLLARLAGTHPGVRVSVAYFVALAAASYGGAIASYHLLEKHFLGLKRHFSVERVAARSAAA